MRLEDINTELRDCVFEFFYWFSRFEFALKENRFLRSRDPEARAEPSWDGFIRRYEAEYQLTEVGSLLVRENPLRQVVGDHGLVFVPVGFGDQPSDLEKVVRLLKTVRNNLFHGGKHGNDGWDDPARILVLLNLSIRVLNELADLGDFQADYKRYY